MLIEGRRLFGTDGVRGVANSELTADFALALGRAAGGLLDSGQVVVGRDTRRSGEMLSGALQAGFHSVGIDTLDAGVVPSGAVSRLAAAMGAGMGAIVSASHNPAPDNGIKFLTASGAKLTDAQEDEIEVALRRGRPGRIPVGQMVGTRFPLADATERYVAHLAGTMDYSLRGIEVAVDCANGAAYQAAPRLLRRLKAEVEVFADVPDGTNINQDCGATHPEMLAGAAGGRLGLCFDGDADRLIAIDESGRVANGDVIMAVIARHWVEQGRLAANTVVATVMSNLGFRKAMEELGVRVIETQVGDRYVVEAMVASGASLGGEQSGHLIFPEFAPTGDGLLTALRLLEVVAATGKTLEELRRAAITEYPQVLKNVRVAAKEGLSEADAVWRAVTAAEERMDGNGRILVRASGTEPLVRVMVEAPTAEEAETVVDELAAIVARELTDG